MKPEKTDFQKHTIKIQTSYIKLDSFLKFISACQTGGEAKFYIQDGLVKVNNSICLQRGKKLYNKDIVEFNDISYFLSAPEEEL